MLDYLDQIKKSKTEGSSEILVKLTGRYYTHEVIARNALTKLLEDIRAAGFYKKRYTICDPFSGDGRLVFWFLQLWSEQNLPEAQWTVELWDIDGEGLNESELAFDNLFSGRNDIRVIRKNCDSFKAGRKQSDYFDFVVTNPPWELLKPDRRELMGLSKAQKEVYLADLRHYDNFLAKEYPLSQPLRKFAGWGTNLSRVGVDLTRNLLKHKGWAMMVLPASFFADGQSNRLRFNVFTRNYVSNIEYYPAEARLFGGADINSSTMIFQKNGMRQDKISLSVYDKNLEIKSSGYADLADKYVDINNFSIPISLGAEALPLMEKFSSEYPRWHSLEGEYSDGLWAGREIDETGIGKWLRPDENGSPTFVKGKMIDRYNLKCSEFKSVKKNGWKLPSTVDYDRIAWRDVSRSSQKRRVIATIIPKGFVAGNSLGVCLYRDGNLEDTKILLAIFNSMCFEYQLRNYLATGHISLSSIRKVHIPSRTDFNRFRDLVSMVDETLSGNSHENEIEAFVARRVYNLTKSELQSIMSAFDKLEDERKQEIMQEYDKLDSVMEDRNATSLNDRRIFNHRSASLSQLDMAIVRSVPPGGNWKDIPKEIPSKRVQTIRESYAAGKGSRSTYYGRLRPDMPSYTINTYLSRPGNGCHIHYSQDRVISQREAARLQSFPDSFEFVGSQHSINTQIGNAVPPLLAYQIAKEVTKVAGKGVFIDLFSGAGGMALGFKWAGWKPLLANDIDKRFLETYSRNIHSQTILGSISKPSVFKTLVDQAVKGRIEHKNYPFWVLGGPPCQGFSTAGKRRTMSDERNLLFMDYSKFLEKVQPDGFLFENVSGLLNMDRGRVFELVKKEFQRVMNKVDGFVLQSEHYAIPQRRKRVFLIGQRVYTDKVMPPKVLTKLDQNMDLFSKYPACVSVSEALSDLPELAPGQNGDCLDYVCPPANQYQGLMRGLVKPDEYLSAYCVG